MASGRQIIIDFIGNDKSLSSTARGATSSTSKLGDTLKKVGKMAALGLAAGAAATAVALVDMTKSAIEDQKAHALLANQLRNSAGATKEQIAATEEWISKQGVAYGVTDDELRPALSKLVTATHDVGKAQKLASLAMDVSAGTGKSLESVSMALMKAQNGQVSGLARLGVATKDAHGNTLSLKQVTKEMAETFKGAAAKNAGTLEGKMGRLKLMFNETKEAIGYKLIPIVTDLADMLLNNLVPTFTRLGTNIQTTILPPIRQFASDLMARLGPAVKQIIAGVRQFVPVVQVWGATLTQQIIPAIVALASYIANKLMPVFSQIVGIVATRVVPILVSLGKFIYGQLVPAVLKIATAVGKNLKPVFDQLVATFQAKILPTLDKVLKKLHEWQPTIQKVILVVVKLVGFVLVLASAILGKVLPVVIKLAGWLIGKLVGAIIATIEVVAKIIGKIIEFGGALVNGIEKVARFQAAVREKMIAALGVITGIPGKVIGAIGNLGNLLYNAGQAIIEGLINGIRSMAGALVSEITHSVTDKIPGFIKDRLGIHSPSVLLTKIGVNIMEGLIQGIHSKRTSLVSVLEKVTGYVKAQADKLKGLISDRNSFAAGFRSFSGSVFSADFTDPDTGASTASVSGLIDYQKAQQQKAASLKRDVGRLVKMGLSKDLIQQLAASGEQGIAQIHALAGGSAAQVRQLNGLNASTNSLLTAAGMSAGNSIYGDRISQTRQNEATASAIAKALKRHLDDRDKNTEVVLKLDGRTIQISLLQLKRKTGKALNLA